MLPRSDAPEATPERAPIQASAALDQITAGALALGRERLHPSRRNGDYLALNERRKRLAEWLQCVPGNELRVLDVGGRIQPYRPMLNGRLGIYIAVDPQKTGLLDAVAVGEHLPFPDVTFDLVLCTGVLCYVEDPYQVIEEIYRVLRPGGTLLLVTPALLPYHAENDRWRFFPGGLRILLSRFSHVEVSPEGYSLAGICWMFALFLDMFVENWALRQLIPLVNLVGERLDHWTRGYTQFTANYDAFARK